MNTPDDNAAIPPRDPIDNLFAELEFELGNIVFAACCQLDDLLRELTTEGRV